jgi:hypothetical protein
MIIPTHLGTAGPLMRVHALLHSWALERLVSFDLMFVDLRLALATAAARALVQTSDAIVRHVMGRAWKGARLAQGITAAATMVAAAGR